MYTIFNSKFVRDHINIDINTPILIPNVNRLEADLRLRMANDNIIVVLASQCEITLDVISMVIMDNSTYMLLWMHDGTIHSQKCDVDYTNV